MPLGPPTVDVFYIETKSCAIEAGPCDTLVVSRNLANYETFHLKKIAISR